MSSVRMPAAIMTLPRSCARMRQRQPAGEIIARVLAEGIAIDTKITADTRRIIRVPGTINSKTG